MKWFAVTLAVVCLCLVPPELPALTEAQLLGTWELTGYLAVRETDQGSYHLVIDDSQHSPEYALLTRARFAGDGVCAVTLSVPEGETEELPARFQKQTVDGQEFIRLRWGTDQELTVTLRPIDPGQVTTLFYLSTTKGRGQFASYYYDTFGTMEKIGD